MRKTTRSVVVVTFMVIGLPIVIIGVSVLVAGRFGVEAITGGEKAHVVALLDRVLPSHATIGATKTSLRSPEFIRYLESIHLWPLDADNVFKRVARLEHPATMSQAAPDGMAYRLTGGGASSPDEGQISYFGGHLFFYQYLLMIFYYTPNDRLSNFTVEVASYDQI